MAAPSAEIVHMEKAIELSRNSNPDEAGIVNNFGEGGIPSVDAWTPSGNIFLNAEGVVAWLPGAERCLFAAALHVGSAP